MHSTWHAATGMGGEVGGMQGMCRKSTTLSVRNQSPSGERCMRKKPKPNCPSHAKRKRTPSNEPNQPIKRKSKGGKAVVGGGSGVKGAVGNGRNLGGNCGGGGGGGGWWWVVR